MSKWERVSGQLDNKDRRLVKHYETILLGLFLFLLRYKIMEHSVINTPPPLNLEGGALWRGIGYRPRLRYTEGSKYAKYGYAEKEVFKKTA